MASATPIVIAWFRRDLRLHDNHAFWQALQSGMPVLPLFILDTSILSELPGRHDRRVDFIHQSLAAMKAQLEHSGSSLMVLHDTPLGAMEQLAAQYNVKAVYTNHDYEPQAIARDTAVGQWLHSRGIAFHTYKDQVIFEKSEVLKDDGNPYTVYTPYMRRWKARLKEQHYAAYPSGQLLDRCLTIDPLPMPTLTDIGFEPTGIQAAVPDIHEQQLRRYHELRDFPAINATSRLSVHLRFGTVSIRSLVRAALQLNDTWLNELIWREFFMMILFHFPHVVKHAFKPAYDHIPWRNSESDFQAWCEGRTGYPIVDAGMRELNETGFMHNRVRMVTASFLVKHLLIDWRWGEAYFAQQLLDFDLSANNGNWQWAAGTGCDAAPYFRVFNPAEQTRKFDADLQYIRRWVPELDTFQYPQPMVAHSFARDRALQVYKAALGTKAE